MKKTIKDLFLGSVVLASFFALLFLLISANREVLAQWLFGDKPTEIERGFSAELREMLEREYCVQIPENADFDKGYFTNGFRETYVVIQFDLDLSEEAQEIEAIISEMKEGLRPTVTKSQKRQMLFDQAIADHLFKGDGWNSNSGGINELSSIHSFVEEDDLYSRCFNYYGKYEDWSTASLYFNVLPDGIIQCCFIGDQPGNAIR